MSKTPEWPDDLAEAILRLLSQTHGDILSPTLGDIGVNERRG